MSSKSKMPGGRKVALITGSGRRLGRKSALALAEDGWDIIINYSKSAKEAAATVKDIAKLDIEAILIKADIRNSKQVDRMFRQALDHFGRLDLLVNNAAIFPPRRTITDMSDELWNDVISTNLTGQFYCARAAAKIMAQRGGKIINFASLGGMQAWQEHIAYNVSKAGVIMLTKALSKVLAPKITVNAIAPGTIIIPGEESKNIRHIDESKIPLKRYGRAEDITMALLYLAHADYVTGQILVVDGGRAVL
ncbi:MAG TPA: SDR family oxidoreductase [Candidatus Acidoferrales bacterium]|nr:SDR family oxidoreductase [Candidatus Acidoferrales bacterium]